MQRFFKIVSRRNWIMFATIMQAQNQEAKQTFKTSQATIQKTIQETKQETRQMTTQDQKITQEVDARLKRENGNLGFMTASLTWNTCDDLDLSCILPNGKRIYYMNRKCDGGILDVDMNAGCNFSCKTPIENIYWPLEPQKGKYIFCVHNYKSCETEQGEKIHFCLTIRVGDQIHHEFGYLTKMEPFNIASKKSLFKYHMQYGGENKNWILQYFF